jgi:hypothetical protein
LDTIAKNDGDDVKQSASSSSLHGSSLSNSERCDPGAVLDLLSLRHEPLQTACAEGQIVESLIHVVSDIFYKTKIQSINSTARYLLWMLVANCLFSAPTHITNHNAFESKTKALLW